jgi:hypothetical protein
VCWCVGEVRLVGVWCVREVHTHPTVSFSLRAVGGDRLEIGHCRIASGTFNLTEERVGESDRGGAADGGVDEVRGDILVGARKGGVKLQIKRFARAIYSASMDRWCAIWNATKRVQQDFRPSLQYIHHESGV